jgi:hypothetical protein
LGPATSPRFSHWLIANARLHTQSFGYILLLSAFFRSWSQVYFALPFKFEESGKDQA